MLILVVRSVGSSECPQTSLSTNCVSYTFKIYPELDYFSSPTSVTTMGQTTFISHLNCYNSFFVFFFFSLCPPLLLFVLNVAITMILLNHTAEHLAPAQNPSVAFILKALAVTSTYLITVLLVLISYFCPCLLCSSHTGFLALPSVCQVHSCSKHTGTPCVPST